MNEIGKVDETYEYPSPIKLKGLESKYICIPSSIIYDTDIDVKRVAIFSYFIKKKGLDNTIGFTIPLLVKWCGLKPDTRSNGISQKFIDIINNFKDMDFLTYSEELTKTSHTEIEFNSDKIYELCQDETFSILYLDEIEKIMSYKNEDDKDKYFNNTILLLVFAYFRSMIYRRSNKLKLDEINVDNMQSHEYDLEYRRGHSPEAYYDNYNTISERIGISARLVSKAVSILEEELGLLVTDEAYRVRNENGEFRTQYTLFANSYKREGEFLLATGEDYSRPEIERKAEIIQKYNSKFIIDKKKRKSTKKGVE